MTVLRIPGVANVRDVGGIPVAGGRIRDGVLLRSGHLAQATAEGGEMLRARVRRIVDLRDDAEVRQEPCAVEGIEVTRIPLFLGSIASFFQDDVSLDGLYRHLVDDAAERLVEVARIVSMGEPTLVHCTIGKDRTGVSVALALSAVGADREAVIADYALTASQLPPERTRMVTAWLRSAHPEAVHAVALATESPAEVMRGLLDGIDAAHGSAAEYLRASGLAAAELDALREVLVERG